MNVKMTMKVGDKVQVMNDSQTREFTEDGKGFEQLIEAKGALTMITGMIDVMQPSEAGKRIELMLEFDDGQFIVIGRKAKVDPDDGR